MRLSLTVLAILGLLCSTISASEISLYFLAEQPQVCTGLECSDLDDADGHAEREAATYTCSGYDVTTTEGPTTHAGDVWVHAPGIVAETLRAGIATRPNPLPPKERVIHELEN